MKILIVDDHKMVLEGTKEYIKTHLEKEPFIKTASDKKSLFKALDYNRFDVILLDLSLGNEDARIFIKDIYKKNPEVKIIVVSSMEDPEIVKGLMNNVEGFVGKSNTSNHIIEAIQTVWKGEKYLAPLSTSSQQKSKKLILTRREKEVLQEILKEKTTKEIADTLYVSKKTVEYHRGTLFQKFNVTNATGLIKKAIQMGFLKLDS